MTFMVEFTDEATVDRLREIGNVVFRSSLVPWLALEADGEQQIADVPGVKQVYPEGVGEFYGQSGVLV